MRRTPMHHTTAAAVVGGWPMHHIPMHHTTAAAPCQECIGQVVAPAPPYPAGIVHFSTPPAVGYTHLLCNGICPQLGYVPIFPPHRSGLGVVSTYIFPRVLYGICQLHVCYISVSGSKTTHHALLPYVRTESSHATAPFSSCSVSDFLYFTT